MKIAILSTIGAALLGLGVWAYATEAECAYCTQMTCYDSSVCGAGCVCAKSQGSTSGYCLSY